MAALDQHFDIIADLIIYKNFTHKQVSQHLIENVQNLGTTRGLSEASVRRFCHDNSIKRNIKLTRDEVHTAVAHAVDEV